MNIAEQQAFNDAYDAYLDGGEWLEYIGDDAPEILRIIWGITMNVKDNTGEHYTPESRMAEIHDLLTNRADHVCHRLAEKYTPIYLED